MSQKAATCRSLPPQFAVPSPHGMLLVRANNVPSARRKRGKRTNAGQDTPKKPPEAPRDDDPADSATSGSLVGSGGVDGMDMDSFQIRKASEPTPAIQPRRRLPRATVTEMDQRTYVHLRVATTMAMTTVTSTMGRGPTKMQQLALSTEVKAVVWAAVTTTIWDGAFSPGKKKVEWQRPIPSKQSVTNGKSSWLRLCKMPSPMAVLLQVQVAGI